MRKLKLPNGKVVTVESDAEFNMYMAEFPGTIEVAEDFQQDPANAETSVGSDENTVSSSENSSSDFQPSTTYFIGGREYNELELESANFNLVDGVAVPVDRPVLKEDMYDIKGWGKVYESEIQAHIDESIEANDSRYFKKLDGYSFDQVRQNGELVTFYFGPDGEKVTKEEYRNAKRPITVYEYYKKFGGKVYPFQQREYDVEDDGVAIGTDVVNVLDEVVVEAEVDPNTIMKGVTAYGLGGPRGVTYGEVSRIKKEAAKVEEIINKYDKELVFTEGVKRYFDTNNILERDAVEEEVYYTNALGMDMGEDWFVGANREVREIPIFESDQAYEDYLASEDGVGDLYDEYTLYRELPEVFKEQFMNTPSQALMEAEWTAKSKAGQIALREYSESMQENMRPFINQNGKFKTPESQQAYFEFMQKDIEKQRFLLENQQLQFQKTNELLGSGINADGSPSTWVDNFDSVMAEMKILQAKYPNGVDADSDPADIDIYNDLITEYNTLIESYKENLEPIVNDVTSTQDMFKLNLETFIDKSENVKNFQIAKQVLDYDYRFMTRVGGSIMNMVVGGVEGLVGGIADVVAAATEDGYINPSGKYVVTEKGLGQGISDWAIQSAEERQEQLGRLIPPALTFDDRELYNGNYGDVLLETFADNAASTLLSLLPVGRAFQLGKTASFKKLSGLAKAKAIAKDPITNMIAGTFFVSSAGNKFNEVGVLQKQARENIDDLKKSLLDPKLNTIEKREVQKQISEYERAISTSTAAKAFSAFTHGLIEYGAEKLGTLKFIAALQDTSKLIGKTAFKKALYTGKIAATGVGIENVEETVTQLGQNGVDIYVLGEDKTLIDGMTPEFFLGTTLSSFAISGPNVGQNLYNIVLDQVKTRTEVKALQKLYAEYNDLQKNKFNFQAGTKERKQMVARQREILQEAGYKASQSMTKLNALSPKQIESLFDVNRRIQKQKQVLEQAGANGLKRNNPVVAAALNKIEQLENTRNEILGTNEANVIKYLDENFNSKGDGERIYLETFAQFNDQLLELNVKEGTYIFNATDIEDLESQMDAQGLIDPNERQKVIDDFNSQDFVAGVVDGKYVVINKTNRSNNIYAASKFGLAEGKFAAVAATHELLHLRTAQAGLLKDGEIKADFASAVLGLKTNLTNLRNTNQISVEEYNMFMDRIQKYESDLSIANPVEELLNLYHDGVELGILQLPGLSVNYGIKSLLNTLGKKFFGDTWQFNEFNTTEDVLMYLKKFNSEARSIRVNTGVDEPDEKRKGKVKSRSAIQLAKLKDKLGGIKVADLNSRESQKIITDNLTGMVEVQVDNLFQNLPTNVREDIIADARADILIYGETKKWDGRGTLYGFLNGRIRFRILDAVRNNPQYLEAIGDNELSNLEGVVDETPVASTPERARYTKLTNSNVVSRGTINDIKNDLISIIRVLKNAINAPTSLNKRVAPIIAELKQAIGKSLIYDKVIQVMGGKAGNKLKSFLIKNKQAILENMTTTYLSQAMPWAVQKSVGGQYKLNAEGQRAKDEYGDFIFIPNWTSDWQGKKVDRIKTSTDKAGTTSGAEFIRRLPNISQAVSDELFLSYMFDGNNLIRGRKESLGKAIAEEIGLEVLENEVLLPDSPANLAFVKNQEMLGVLTGDALVTDLVAKLERGNTKFSKGVDLGQIKQELNDLVLEAIQNPDTFSELLATKPKYLRDIWNDELAITFAPGAAQFKSTLQEWVKENLPESLSAQVDQYFASYTFVDKKLSNATKSSQKQYEKFSLALVDLLPKQLIDKIGVDILGVHNRLLNPKSDLAKKVLNKLAKKKDSKEELPFNVEDVRLFQSGSALMNSISTNILFKDFATAQEKEDAYQDKYLEEVLNANAANKAVLEYLITQITKAVGQDISLLPGYIRYLESNANLGKGIRALSGLASIEFYADSQAPFINIKTGQGYRGINAAQKAKFENNEIVVNRNHPLYSEALQYIEEKGLQFESVDQMDMFIATKLLRDKGEHINPSAVFSLDVLKEQLPLIALIHEFNNPAAVASIENFATLKLQELTQGFDQSLNSNLLSKVQDKKLTSTSTLGVMRLLTNSPKMQQALKTTQGFQEVGRALREVRSLINNIDIKALAKAQTEQQAINNGTKLSKGIKGISVYDFDDTLAFSQSKVIVTMPNGKTKKITPAQFAAQDETLTAQGAVFNFSEFNKVVKGTPGPLAPRLKKAIGKFGNQNIFVLTARPQASAKAIYKFLKGIGLEIPLKNIVGLENGTPAAKAGWMVTKVAEGFNDFYFVDDAMKNVTAVKAVLDVFDVNSKVQQARTKHTKGLNFEFNEMIGRQKGVKPEAMYSKVVAKKKGANKGKFKYFISPSAEDFRGLTSYTFAGRGKQGNADQQWFEDNLIKPYQRGVAAIDIARQNLRNDYQTLLKQFPGIKKKLVRKIPGSEYTYDQALRVYLYTKSGYDMQSVGLSKRDQKFLLSVVQQDSILLDFGNAAQLITKQEKWTAPTEYWNIGSTLKDLNNLTDKVLRKEYLAEFIQNADLIFDEKTLNKIEALYGANQREAIENILRRMKTGSNRPATAGRLEQRWLDWVNNSVGTIMFFNRRSALLQLISNINFINWGDNNPAKAALAFANQPQYWKDFVTLFNSDKLKQRRGGLQSDIQEKEIADAVKNSTNSFDAVVAYLLKIGFTPTRIADSIAIATGGATFYRNRIKTYLKEGLSKEVAEQKAFEDFSSISDETQQSADPMLISQQQASQLGRLILAFQNTPMQYMRLTKKAAQDLINNRGDWKTNTSKIIYYGAVQNFIFSALQNALFALIPGFDEEEEEDEELSKKEIKIAHSMVDTILRGSGLYGAIISTLKNAIRRFNYEEAKGFTADHTYTLLELANISPPVGSKLRKVYGAIQTNRFDKDVMTEMGWDLQINGKFNISPNYKVLGSLSSAFLNIPLDRLIVEVDGVAEMLDDRNSTWQRLALALGWRTWGVNAENEEQETIKLFYKELRALEGKKKAKITRERNKATVEALEKTFLKTNNKYQDYKKQTKGFSVKKRIEWLESQYIK